MLPISLTVLAMSTSILLPLSSAIWAVTAETAFSRSFTVVAATAMRSFPIFIAALDGAKELVM